MGYCGDMKGNEPAQLDLFDFPSDADPALEEFLADAETIPAACVCDKHVGRIIWLNRACRIQNWCTEDDGYTGRAVRIEAIALDDNSSPIGRFLLGRPHSVGHGNTKIGRAACRERVWHNVEISVDNVTIKK